MANYQNSVRSNYFHVKDEDLFMEFMTHVVVDGDDIELLLSTDKNGLPQFGFAAHGLIIGLSDEDDETEEPDSYGDCYEDFLLGLQELVDENDAIIILEIGNSELNDVHATAIIITSDDTDYIDLQELASDKAIDMLAGIMH